jgi:hypothetical protein
MRSHGTVTAWHPDTAMFDVAFDSGEVATYVQGEMRRGNADGEDVYDPLTHKWTYDS